MGGLETIATLVTAQGNNHIWLSEDPRLKESPVLHIYGLRVGITHSLDYPESSRRSLEQAVEAEFGGPVDVFLFGGSHQAMVETSKGVLLLNLCSPTLPIGLRQLGTVGIPEINQGKAADHIS